MTLRVATNHGGSRRQLLLFPRHPLQFFPVRDGHMAHPVIIALSVVIVMALQSQSPTGCSVCSQAFLLSVHLEVKPFADAI